MQKLLGLHDRAFTTSSHFGADKNKCKKNVQNEKMGSIYKFSKNFRNEQKKYVICPKVEGVVLSSNNQDFKMEIKFLWDISHHL